MEPHQCKHSRIGYYSKVKQVSLPLLINYFLDGGDGGEPTKADMTEFLNSDELAAKMKKDFISTEEFGRIVQRVEKMESYMPDLIAKVFTEYFNFSLHVPRLTVFWSMSTS